ncbi:Inner membrane transport permease YbhR [Planctomycetes bacterium Pan216]|uniref:Transport permease protein n=1 Tax=Kolteria novifilia TaxID=2527975 RepID=A0A518B7Z3_9BACT|nr:Inner membrane transport permease YbhR [Planctomycetes bacterium Pan216]
MSSVFPGAKDLSGLVFGFGAAWALAQRELVRFFRQRGRVMGAVGQPLIFWILFGAGFQSSFRPPSAGEGAVSFGQYFYPGIITLVVLFTAIFATISVIQDRREGFMQGVLIAPVPRSMIALGNVLGGTLIALFQAWIFLLLAPLTGISLSLVMIVAASLYIVVLGIALTSLGLCLAWRSDSVQGFHAMMTLLLFPLWLLSGAFFPAEGAPLWLAWVIRLNPVSYGVAGLRRILDWGRPASDTLATLPSLGLCVLVSVCFAAIMFWLATWTVSRVASKGA